VAVMHGTFFTKPHEVSKQPPQHFSKRPSTEAIITEVPHRTPHTSCLKRVTISKFFCEPLAVPSLSTPRLRGSGSPPLTFIDHQLIEIIR
jgi:hypothetical protein